MPTRIDEYKIAIKKEEILISADSFAPYKLGVAKDVIVKGSMYVHGDVGCVALRGGNMASTVLLQSGAVTLGDFPEAVIAFISPIEGFIKRASLIIHAGTGSTSDVYEFYFFSEHGVKATSVLTVVNPSVTETAEFIEFNLRDPQDLAFCSVGIGTPFVIRERTSTIVGDTVVTICVEIFPAAGGGLYV